MVKARPIWHPASPRSAYFRLSVKVSAGSKDGHLRCACSGAFQLALDGVRLDGGPAGLDVIERLLDQIEEAMDRLDWESVRNCALAVIALDSDNSEAFREGATGTVTLLW